MNTQTYRLVFNPARACMVAVAETARGYGKGGAAGSTRARRRKGVSASRCRSNWSVALVGYRHLAINSGVFTPDATGSTTTTTTVTAGLFANGSTGTVIAANQLNIKAGSFTNAGSNVTTGVGSLGNASLITTGVWDAGSNALKVNGLLTANTDGITVAVGKTWEQANVNWSGTLTNLGTTNLGIANGTAINQSSGSIERTDVPNSDPALAGSYHYTATPPVGYSTATLKSYTDVLNRAKLSAVNFTGGLVRRARQQPRCNAARHRGQQ